MLQICKKVTEIKRLKNKPILHALPTDTRGVETSTALHMSVDGSSFPDIIAPITEEGARLRQSFHSLLRPTMKEGKSLFRHGC